MKRFIIAVIALGAVGLGIYYFIYFRGFYIPQDQGSLDVPFKTEERQLMEQTEDGSYEPLTLRGVELSASMPGHYANEFYADKEDYLRWLTAIGEMGANTVRVPVIMDDDFYNALYEYNTSGAPVLYLLQSLPVADIANYGEETAYSDEFLGSLKANGRILVDILHGRRSVAAGTIGNGHYRKDVSPWVVGIMVGGDWNPDMIAYTDHTVEREMPYEGDYFQAAKEASAFENMLAMVLDELAAYEAQKYGALRPLGFAGSPDTDFLEYDENYALQLNKYSFVDAEHVLPKASMAGGYFTAYHLYDYCEEFAAYLSAEQKASLGTLLENLDTSAPYGGYLELLAGYHTMPVIASGYGFSTARGTLKPDQEPMTELMQGRRLMDIYEAAIEAGWAGMCISSFQDVWDQSDWNLAFAEDIERSYYWGDRQSVGKNYGLMAFEPGETQAVCIVDGDPREWADDTPVFSGNGLNLYAKYDFQGLYLLIEGDFDPESGPLYIPIDLSGDVGSLSADQPSLSFDRAVDFILCIDGKEESRLLVWERYLATRANFNTEMNGQDPFVNYPSQDSRAFVPVITAVENQNLLEDYANVDPQLRQELTALGSFEAGKLVYGSGDSNAPDFNSLADFYFGENCVEARLPWLLLNVGDPSAMAVHEDYYANYGVELEKISRLWLGIAREGELCSLSSFRVKGTGKTPRYHERLKQSYEVIQNEWGGLADECIE